MWSKAMLFIAWFRALEVIPSLFTNEKFQASVEFRCYLSDNTEEVDMPNTRFLLKHEISHMKPVLINEAVGERETE